ncbi:MAG: hypothetical protein E6G92_10500 [Alphaproteobacteria bacterium]|nr:MAG: hypothetical protein E6G92_10500 [Alphaproteobacteria bacterium]
MIRPLLLAACAIAALAACSPKADDSVANSFDRTEKAIENTADTLEAETENATRAASDALEREAGEFANRADAIENAATNAK